MDRTVHDAFLEAVISEADAVRLGDPFDKQTTLGPLNNEAVAADLERHVADGEARGAKVLRRGRRQPGSPTDLLLQFTVADQVPVDSLPSG